MRARSYHHNNILFQVQLYHQQKEILDKIKSPSFSPDDISSHEMKPKPTQRIPSTPKSLTQPTLLARAMPRSQGWASSGRRSVLNTALSPNPGEIGSRESIISVDSGIGMSGGGEVRRPSLHKSGSNSVPSSGSGTFSNRGGPERKCHSACGQFIRRKSELQGVTVCQFSLTYFITSYILNTFTMLPVEAGNKKTGT